MSSVNFWDFCGLDRNWIVVWSAEDRGSGASSVNFCCFDGLLDLNWTELWSNTDRPSGISSVGFWGFCLCGRYWTGAIFCSGVGVGLVTEITGRGRYWTGDGCGGGVTRLLEVGGKLETAPKFDITWTRSSSLSLSSLTGFISEFGCCCDWTSSLSLVMDFDRGCAWWGRSPRPPPPGVKIGTSGAISDDVVGRDLEKRTEGD